MHKAKHHAQKAIEACDAGDKTLAAHHFGHALASLKSQKDVPEEMGMAPAPTPKGVGLGTIRNRLKGFRKLP